MTDTVETLQSKSVEELKAAGWVCSGAVRYAHDVTKTKPISDTLQQLYYYHATGDSVWLDVPTVSVGEPERTTSPAVKPLPADSGKPD